MNFIEGFFYAVVLGAFDIARGTHVEKAYRSLLESQWWDQDQLRMKQEKKLRRLVEFAYHNSQFYRDEFDRIGLLPGDVNSLDDLRKLPILTRNQIKRHFPDRIVAKNIRRGFSLYSTNGSTGEPMKFYKDTRTKTYAMACTKRSWNWAGSQVGDKTATIWGNSNFLRESQSLKKRIKRLFLREILFPACNLIDENSIRKSLCQLSEFKPDFICGYTQTLYLICAFMRKEQIHVPRPKAIITTAETLLDSQRIIIEEQFGAPIFDHYGCGEIESIAFECEAHNGYHIMDEHVIVEIVKSDGSFAAKGETGALVITDLDNRIMPFIRYRNGDQAVAAGPDPCACGRGLSKISRILGRETDVIFTPDRKALSLPSFFGTHVLNEISGIEQFQVIQEALGKITVKIVADSSFDQNSHERLLALTRTYVGDKVKVHIQRVDSLEPEVNGKIRIVKSNVTIDEWL